MFVGRGSLDAANVPVYAIDPHKNFIGVLGGVFGPKDRTAFYRAMLDNECSEIVSLINLSSEYFSSSWNEQIRSCVLTAIIATRGSRGISSVGCRIWKPMPLVRLIVRLPQTWAPQSY